MSDWIWPSPSHWSWVLPAPAVCRRCIPAKYGSLPHIEVLINEYLVEHLEPKVLETASNDGAPPHILEFILARMTPNWVKVIESAAKGGHVHAFKWIMKERRDGRGPWKADFRQCMDMAAAHGHLELVKWLHSRGTPAFNNCALEQAAINDNLTVARWLHEHAGGICKDSTMIYSVERGHFEVVRWLYENFEEARVVNGMSSAAREGHLDILRWLHERKSCGDECTSGIMDQAAHGGHLDVVKWLYGNCSKGCSFYAAQHAARNGDFAMLQWLDEHFSGRFTAGAMDEAASSGHLGIVKWLHEHRTEGCTTRAMDAAAAHGHLEVVQWLHSNRSEGCTQNAMDWAVEMGKLDVVRWLHDNRSEGWSDYVIIVAAREGYLEVVKWLNETRPESGSETLQIAAWEGHLDMVRYLDANTTHRDCNWGLSAAARRGHLQVLLVLVREYYLDDVSVEWSTYSAIQQCFVKILRQLSDQSASPASPLWQEVLEAMGQFHSSGFHSCVCTMLDLALQGGYSQLVRQFYELPDDQEKRKYVAAACRLYLIVLVRWMLENGAQLDVPTAINLAIDYPYSVEASWWLSESDRVTLVCEGVEKKEHCNLLLWVLDHTDFTDATSRTAISAAVRLRNDGTVEWLSEKLSNIEARSWCLPAK